MDKREGEVSRLSFENFFSQNAKKFRRRTLLCFRKILVPKNARDKRGGGYHDFLSKLFCHIVPNPFVVEPFCVSQNFQFRKNLWMRGGGKEEEKSITIFCRKIFVSKCRKTSQGNPSVLCFRKLPVAKNFMDKKGAVSRFSFENFLSHSAENFRRGTLQGVTDFGYRKILCLGALCHNFSSNFFVSQYRKTLHGNPSVLCFRKFLVAKKFMDKRERGIIKTFLRIFFVSESRKLSSRNPSVFQKVSGTEECQGEERGWVSRFSVKTVLSNSTESFRRRTLLSSTRFLVSKKFIDKRGQQAEEGNITNFSRKIFLSQCRKTLQGNPSVLYFTKLPVAKKFMDKKWGSVKFFRRNGKNRPAPQETRGTTVPSESNLLVRNDN